MSDFILVFTALATSPLALFLYIFAVACIVTAIAVAIWNERKHWR